jgi:hypothetical protein
MDRLDPQGGFRGGLDAGCGVVGFVYLGGDLDDLVELEAPADVIRRYKYS